MEYKTIAAAYWTPNTIFKVPREWDIGDVKVVKDILYYKGEIKDVPKRVSIGDDNTNPIEMFDNTDDLNSDDEFEDSGDEYEKDRIDELENEVYELKRIIFQNKKRYEETMEAIHGINWGKYVGGDME
jgi:hypothetical protein